MDLLEQHLQEEEKKQVKFEDDEAPQLEKVESEDDEEESDSDETEAEKEWRLKREA